MKKNMKMGIAIVSVLVFGSTSVGLYVSNMNKEVANPVPVIEENVVTSTVENEKVDTVVNTETGLTDNDTVETEDSAFVINTEVEKVIESDKETGSETIVNTDGDVVVTNDEALVIAESNSGADDILADILADIIIEDSGSEVKADKAEIKVNAKEVKNDEELKKAYSSETTSTKKNNDTEIDEATKDLFAEMGWRTDAAEHQTDIEGGVWTFQEGKTKGNPFRTP